MRSNNFKSENLDVNGGELVKQCLSAGCHQIEHLELWRLLKRNCCCISLQEPPFGAGLTNWMALCQMRAIRISKD